jgi:hypothetical protein
MSAGSIRHDVVFVDELHKLLVFWAIFPNCGGSAAFGQTTPCAELLAIGLQLSFDN